MFGILRRKRPIVMTHWMTPLLDFGSDSGKFYEAVQGRLALAVRDDLTLAPWVRKWGNGIVVPGHSGSELAASLKGLTPDEVLRMKNASHVVAQSVNAEAEGRRFLEIVS